MEMEEKDATAGGRPRAKLAFAFAGTLGLLGISAAVLMKPRVGQGVPALAVHAESEAAAFTFEQFVQQYGRTYVPGSEAYARRAEIFRQSLAEIEALNAGEDAQFWHAGPNHFMDWTVDERSAMRGYDKRAKQVSMKAKKVGTEVKGGPPADWAPPESGGMTFDDPRGPMVRNQGGCGSCWAFASASVAEAYILKDHVDKKPSDINLAEQVLVDCVENPNHCGGTGGCQGATQGLAYEFMRDHGLPLEQEAPYTAEDGQCVPGGYPASPLARVTGWRDLASNYDQRPLMYELMKGPVAVAVAATMGWDFYGGGVFNCRGATGLDHAVLAKGFGKQDYRLGPKLYWLIMNSWGEDWGEQGHIRLLRAKDEAQVCGQDKDASMGMACDGDPETVKVCGACGILYAPVVPDGVTLSDPHSALTMV